MTAAASRLEEASDRARTARDSILPLADRQRDLALRAWQSGETGVVATLDALRTARQVAAEVVDDLLRYQEARADWISLTRTMP